jgi:hypothetical protein
VGITTATPLTVDVKFNLDLREYAFVADVVPQKVKIDSHSTEKKIARCGMLKPLDEARKYFDSRLGTETTWPEVDAAQQPLP